MEREVGMVREECRRRRNCGREKDECRVREEGAGKLKIKKNTYVYSQKLNVYLFSRMKLS